MIKKVTADMARELTQNYYDTTTQRHLNWIYERIEARANMGYGGLLFSNEGYEPQVNSAIIADLEQAGYYLELENLECHTYICWWDRTLDWVMA